MKNKRLRRLVNFASRRLHYSFKDAATCEVFLNEYISQLRDLIDFASEKCRKLQEEGKCLREAIDAGWANEVKLGKEIKAGLSRMVGYDALNNGYDALNNELSERVKEGYAREKALKDENIALAAKNEKLQKEVDRGLTLTEELGGENRKLCAAIDIHQKRENTRFWSRRSGR